MNRRILVIIPYDITIGFAFSRLIGVFLEACAQAAGTVSNVHFAFSTVGEEGSSALPPGFSNLLEFNSRKHDGNDVARLCAYVGRHGIEAAFIVDVGVEAGYLRDIRRAGVRTIIAYWGAPLSSLNHGFKLALKRLEVRYLRPSKPDHFIVESRSMQQTATNGRGIPVHMTTIVPTGVDEARFRPRPESHKHVYDRFAIPAHRSIVVFMGHLHRRKGVHVLLQAADHIVRERHRSDMHFLFLGNQPGEAEVFRGSYDEGATAPFITFGGYQSDVPALLAGCHIGCVPTTGWDSFPLSPLEMQASGLPVVVSDCQGLPESVSDGVTGLVVPAGDVVALSTALQRMTDDRELRDRMSVAAMQRIRASFTRARQVEGLRDVVCRVAGWLPLAPSAIQTEHNRK
ncbi:glycosyltransferase family 4 protein [Nitrospira sp. NS4]|uniref:glycosyltransferase family 4 protein n=1 Tax=Nitrospira sp. NS4 TaxID=3414498 RepID=UPI003C2C9B66